MIEAMETKVTRCNNCYKCMYRDCDIGHCWYTMTTNKPNSISTPNCKHFVDKESAIRKWNKLNNIEEDV